MVVSITKQLKSAGMKNVKPLKPSITKYVREGLKAPEDPNRKT